jgi:hypothetical protein
VTTAKQYLDKQRSFLGTVGGPPNGNHTIFGAFTGCQNLAWCGSFQLFCAHEVGLALPPHVNPLTVATRDGFREYEKAGRSGTEPRVGAHVFYDWSGKKDPKNIHHIECVESILPHGQIMTIGGNVDSKVQRVRRSLKPFIVGFGYPVYAGEAAPKAAPNMAFPTISLGRLIVAAKTDPQAAQGHQTSPNDVRLLEAALLAEHLLDNEFAHDGSYGTVTIAAYAAWQRSLGFHGADADGVPGTQSLTALARRHNLRVTA